MPPPFGPRLPGRRSERLGQDDATTAGHRCDVPRGMVQHQLAASGRRQASGSASATPEKHDQSHYQVREKVSCTLHSKMQCTTSCRLRWPRCRPFESAASSSFNMACSWLIMLEETVMQHVMLNILYGIIKVQSHNVLIYLTEFHSYASCMPPAVF